MGWILLYMYLSVTGLSLSSFFGYYALYERKKRKLGYINRYWPSVFDWFDSFKHFANFFIITFFPFFQLAPIGVLIRCKERMNDDLSGELDSHELWTIEEAQRELTGYSKYNKKLAKTILKTRKANNRYLMKIAKKEQKYDALKAVALEEKQVISLPQKVISVRRIHEKTAASNQVKPFSEYSYDEKINLLLAELEIAFQEKAEAEGIDIDKEVKLLLESKEK